MGRNLNGISVRHLNLIKNKNFIHFRYTKIDRYFLVIVILNDHLVFFI